MMEPGSQPQDDQQGIGATIAGVGKGFREGRKARKEEEERAKQAEIERRARVRKENFDATAPTCPLPIMLDDIEMPAGLRLFEDEFVIQVAKDWGLSTKKLILTTHRLIHAKGLLTKDQESIALTDVSDINFHKGLILPGELTIETAGGHSLTGLPFAKKSKDLRNQLMELVNWAKNRASRPVVITAPAAAPAPVAPDKYAQLAKLGELKAAGVLSEEEFAAEKEKLLGT